MSTLEVPGARLQLERMKSLGQEDAVVTGIHRIRAASEKQETLLEGAIRRAGITEAPR